MAVSITSCALPSPALNANLLSSTICIVSLLYVVSPVTVKLPGIVTVVAEVPILTALLPKALLRAVFKFATETSVSVLVIAPVAAPR